MTAILIDALRVAARAAADAIPPAWPLAATVAVNPFLGQSGEDLESVAARLGRIAGVSVTMPREWYADRITAGTVTDDDLAAALAAADPARRPVSPDALKAAISRPSSPVAALPTVADLAAAASGIDWPAVIAERFGHWAAGWFDEGQALWAAPRGGSAYAAWRAVATHDLVPEIFGLRGFAASVAAAPEAADAALAQSVQVLGVPMTGASSYFHQLLTTLGGWAQAARQRRWEAELGGGEDGSIEDFLTIRLHWDAALLAQYRPQIGEQWEATLAAHAAPLMPTASQVIDTILQEATERAGQRGLAATLARVPSVSAPLPPRLQLRSVSTFARRSSDALSKHSTRGSRRSASPASSGWPQRTTGLAPILSSAACRSS